LAEPPPNVSTAARLSELLLRWEEQRDLGNPPTVAELCRDAPELEPELARMIGALEKMRGPLGTTIDEPAGPSTTPDEDDDGPMAPPPAVAGFDVESILGRGGMGVVYKARQLSLDRPVALKMVLAGAHAGAKALARFKAEAEAVGRLQHPHIVQVFDVDQADGCPYLALEFMEGGSLHDALAAGPLAPREAALVVRAIARAIDFAHRRGIIHRDLKPANVLFTGPETPLEPGSRLGLPKLTDFGLAKRLEGGQALTRSGTIIGTPAYMAPEQVLGESERIGPRSDVYGLGAVLYEALTARPPFTGGSSLEVLRKVEIDEPIRPTQWVPTIPLDLEAISLRCLRKEPAGRFATAADLAEDLDRWLAGRTTLTRPPGRLGRLGRRVTRRRALAGLTLVGASALGLRQWSRRGPTSGLPGVVDGRVKAEAARRRSQMIAELLARRSADGWFAVDGSAAAREGPDRRDLWTHALALEALLSAPEVDADGLRAVVAGLAAPFAPGVPIVAKGVKFGWPSLYREGKKYCQAHPALHLASALALALGRGDVLDAARGAAARDHLAYCHEVLRLFRPEPFGGGWSMFPRQRPPDDEDPYTTSQALSTLIVTRDAGLAWDGSVPRRDDLLRRTAGWIAGHFDDDVPATTQRGWRATEVDSDPVIDGLTLRNYTLLLRARAEAGFEVPRRILDAIPAHLGFLGRRGPDFTDDAGIVRYKFVDREGTPAELDDLIRFNWYQWAVRCALLWHEHGPTADDTALARRTLAHLVLDPPGEAAVGRALAGKTRDVARILIAYSCIPPVDADAPRLRA
jgi:hypothetical protein